MENQNLEFIKKQLIENINKKLEDKIIEQSNADLIIKLVNNAETVKEAVDIAALGTTYKKTGFHFDKRLDKIVNNGRIKYFKKNDELSFSDGNDRPVNKLIIGDNFDALQNLLIQYKNSINVIYIDPPYGKDSMGQFAETNYNNALTRDNLLSMLYPRLVLARELMSEDGVIFCSIDDRNQAYVKCLFDEVFNENSFIGMFMWFKSATPPNLSKKIKKNLEYILCYQKVKDNSRFAGYKTSSKSNDPTTKSQNTKKQWTFPKGSLIIDKEDGIIKAGVYGTETYPNVLKNDLVIRNKTNENEVTFENKFIWVQESLIENLPNIKMYLSPNLVLSYKRDEYNIPAPSNLINEEIGVSTTEEAGDKLDLIFNVRCFDYPKPVDLIKYLISFVNKTDIKIMDFFAGSGTTGQAVLELNKEDAGKRSFILVQLNEDLDEIQKKATDPKAKITIKNQINLCEKLKRPHELSEIPIERLRRVMIGKSFDGSDDFDWIKKNEPLGGSLDVYEIADVANNESSEGQSPFDVIDETLYGQEKFTDLQDKIEWVCLNFENCQKELIE